MFDILRYYIVFQKNRRKKWIAKHFFENISADKWLSQKSQGHVLSKQVSQNNIFKLPNSQKFLAKIS